MKLDKSLLRMIIKEQIDEMCGPDHMMKPQMDMHHSDDHEADMGRRQMFKTANYAVDIYEMMDDNEDYPAWIQSKLTKIADYIGVVKHYLEYDHVVGEKLDKDADAGDYVEDFKKSDAPQFKGKSKKKRQEMAIAAYLDAKENKK